MVAAGLVAIFSAGCATHCCFMHHEGSPVAFGTTQDGTPVWLYTLRNKNGVEARSVLRKPSVLDIAATVKRLCP